MVWYPPLAEKGKYEEKKVVFNIFFLWAPLIKPRTIMQIVINDDRHVPRTV